jgi:transposase
VTPKICSDAGSGLQRFTLPEGRNPHLEVVRFLLSCWHQQYPRTETAPRELEQDARAAKRTATLFAAMSTLDGTVISMCDDRHRHQEWLKFLRVIDDVTPPDKELHLVADNYATHPKVQKWLARHPRFHVYFTPTSSSWLNMVERFFRDLTEQRLRRGIFRDVEELIMAIGDYIDKHNDNPKPCVWTAKASDVLEKVKRARAVLDNR